MQREACPRCGRMLWLKVNHVGHGQQFYFAKCKYCKLSFRHMTKEPELDHLWISIPPYCLGKYWKNNRQK
jgi:transcription elongation factor Elf1